MLNNKVYTKKCIICGKLFETICGRALTCGKDCRNEYRRRKDREKRSIKTCRNSTLDDVLGKAREAGVSYGKYVAMMVCHTHTTIPIYPVMPHCWMKRKDGT